jgi:hypothetical protein
MNSHITKRKNIRKFPSKFNRKDRNGDGKDISNAVVKGIKNDRERKMECEKDRKSLNERVVF